ncbi:MAG: hypothetical protein K2K09_07645, partial [Lachnospiraceae bacterium]|nr:hypothetical protein [Lachnospiraceae bacterium]
MFGTLVAIIILGAFIFGCSYLWYRGFKKSVAKKKEQDSNAERFGAVMRNTLKHVDRLPIPQGTL